MKIISFSIDQQILDKGSAVCKRMEEYGKLVSSLDIILFCKSPENKIKLANNVTIYPVSEKSKIVAAYKSIMLAKNLADPEAVITVQDPFEVGILGLISSWMGSCAFHVQVHIDFFSPYFKAESFRQRIQSMIAPFVLKKASSIRVVSTKIGFYLAKNLGIPNRKITINPIFVDSNRIKLSPTTIDLHKKFPEFDWIILAASRYVKQKNIPLAIEAFDIFRKKHPKAGMIIIGRGPEESSIKNFVAQKGLVASVRVGDLSKEFSSCMRTCDTFVISSDYEGWGMTAIEAASLAKPIVMTDVGCAGEFIINEENGLIVNVRDADALARAMERYFSDSVFAKKMGSHAERDAQGYMSKEENEKLLLKSWKIALENRK